MTMSAYVFVLNNFIPFRYVLDCNSDAAWDLVAMRTSMRECSRPTFQRTNEAAKPMCDLLIKLLRQMWNKLYNSCRFDWTNMICEQIGTADFYAGNESTHQHIFRLRKLLFMLIHYFVVFNRDVLWYCHFINVNCWYHVRFENNSCNWCICPSVINVALHHRCPDCVI